MVGGVLYTTGGTSRAVVALDAATGAQQWVHREDEGERGAAAPRPLSGRGLAYWTDGREERILYVTPGYRLDRARREDGRAIPSFGTNGAVDLKTDIDQTILPDLDHRRNRLSGRAGRRARRHRHRRRVPAKARRRRVTRTIKATFAASTSARASASGPSTRFRKKGEPGYDTWLNGSAEYTGNTGVWTQVTVDEELGLVYLPVESPTGDYYGGHRPGNNLYGESLVCLDLRTGAKKWHYQIVHHPIWDFDLAAAPILADITVDGRAIKAVAVPTKQGILYVFDRVTGKPVWPFEEKPVEKGDVPGRVVFADAADSDQAAAYAKNGTSLDDLIDFTPELHAQAVAIASRYKLGPIFTPPVVSKADGPIATLARGPTNGGSNWPGGAYDPETHTVYVASSNAAPVVLGLVQPTPGALGHELDRAASRRVPAADAAAASRCKGLSIFKPPYGTISAINLDKGEIAWQVPHGETPDAVRNHEALKGMTIPRTGQPGFIVGHAGDEDARHRRRRAGHDAADAPARRDASRVRQGDGRGSRARCCLPAPVSGSPMTYSVNGKQYIVVAVSGGPYSGEYIALRLPDGGPR